MSAKFPYPEDKDPEKLRELILEMATTINKISKDKSLNALVNSAFDSLTADEILEELKAYNAGAQPLWWVDRDRPEN